MEDGTEVRIRRKADKYLQTIKGSGKKVRSEQEFEISEDQFKALWGATQGRKIEKTRYEIPLHGAQIDLDVFHGEFEGLITAEVEFENEDSCDRFEPPEWFSQEVTDDEQYKNQNLALHGLPEKEKEPDLPRYDLEKGIAEILRKINEKLAQGVEPIVIEIAGGSASGKTSVVAQKLKG
jgi:CYTH domain-containing protein